MMAKGAHRQEKDQRLLLEAQLLLAANTRIQDLASSNAAERREGRHASEMVSGTVGGASP